MIELRHLRHLSALAEHGNFSRAAEAVHITQPALSRSIQALEAVVGAPLFDRNRNGIEPTEMGRLLLRHARSFQTTSNDLLREIRLVKGLELGELRIGVGPFGGSALIGPVVGRLNRLHPKLRVRLVLAPWQELPERARSREVDLVVGELGAIRELEDFAHQALSTHTIEVVCRVGHPIASLIKPTVTDFFTFPLAGPRMPLNAVQPLVEALPVKNRAALIRAGMLTIECDSSSILKSVLIESDALSMMPRFMVSAEIQSGDLSVLPGVDLGLNAQFGVAWLRQRSMSGPGLKFVELLMAHDAGLASDRLRTPASRTVKKRPQPTSRPAG